MATKNDLTDAQKLAKANKKSCLANLCEIIHNKVLSNNGRMHTSLSDLTNNTVCSSGSTTKNNDSNDTPSSHKTEGKRLKSGCLKQIINKYKKKWNLEDVNIPEVTI